MAVGDFPEGATATHKDGRKIVFRDGEWRVAQGATPPATAKDTAARTASTGAADALAQQLSRVQQLYRDNVSGVSFADTGLTPAAAQFDSAAAGLGDQALAAFRVPGSGAQSDTELKAFVAANQPLATDYDARIEEKLRNIRTRLDARRKSLGLPEWDYDTGKAKGGDPASTAAGAAGGNGQPPSGAAPNPFDGGAPPQNRAAGGSVEFTGEGAQMQANALRLSDEQFATFQSLAQSGANADQLAGAVAAFGRPVDAESRKNLEGIAAFYAKPENRGTPLGVDYRRDEVQAVDPGDGAAGAAARGAGNVLTSGLLDEVGALADVVTQGGEYADNLDRRRGMELYDEQNNGGARLAGQLVGGLPLSLLGGGSAQAAARAAGMTALRGGEAPAAARAIANRVLATRVALESGGFGAAYGFGDADGGLGERAVGAGVGGVTGAVLGGAGAYAGGRFARKLAERGRGASSGPTEAQAFGEAAARRNVAYLPADVPGATATRLASGLSNVSLGSIPLSEAAQGAIRTAERAKDAVARGIGTIGDATSAGQAVQRGARSFIGSTKTRGEDLYQAIPIAGGTDANVSSTRAALADLTAGLESNPRLSALVEDSRLKAFADALTPIENVVGPLPRRGVAPAFLGADGKVYAGRIGEQHFSAVSPEARAAGIDGVGFVDKDGRFLNRQEALEYVNSTGERIKPSANMEGELDALDYRQQSKFARTDKPVGNGALSWQDLKSFRTYVGEKLGGPELQSDTSRTALKALYSALSADMEATAAAQGPQALNAFKRANSFWRARQARVENVLSDVLGTDLNKSPDAAFRHIQSLAVEKSGDPLKLGRLIRSLPEDEANTVRATVLDRLGLASAGRQDASQELYSPAEFMTQWSKLSPRAKAILFGGEHRQALDDLVLIADGMKGSSQFANTSRTSLGTNALATIGTFWVNPLLGIASVGGQLGAGKLLANQSFARWLARAPKKPNIKAQRAYVERLTSIARAEPAIANDVLALQQRLVDAFGSAPTRLAADERRDHRAPVNRQGSQQRGGQQEARP